MKKLLLLVLLTTPIFSAEFQIKLSKTSPTELTFDVAYKGGTTEIMLPARAKLKTFKGNDVDVSTQGRVRIGLKVGVPGTEESQEAIFTYSLYLAGNPMYGNVLENWYPQTKDEQKASYQVSIEADAAFIYPYLEEKDSAFVFTTEESPKMVVSRFDRLSETGTPSIQIFKGFGLESSPSDIRRVYEHNVLIFGDKGYDEIIVINSASVPEGVIKVGKKLFLSIPNKGSLRQLSSLIPDVWADSVPYMSKRIFDMFKDAVLRIKPISLPAEEQGPYVTNALFTEVAGGSAYYQEVFAKGLDNSTVSIDVDAPMLVSNQAMLTLALKNLGPESYFAGVKALFSSNYTEGTLTNATNIETQSSNEQSGESPNQAANTANTEVQNSSVDKKEDDKLIPWDVLFQDQLAEPLKSFYLNDAFRKGFELSLKAESNTVFRNSDYIPNMKILYGEEILDVDWQGKRTAQVNAASGWYKLDSGQMLPLVNPIESYYTFDTAMQSLRAKLLERAAALKIPLVERFHRHSELVSFKAGENPFEVEQGKDVYVVVSQVSARVGGNLKLAVQEAFFVLDDTNNPKAIIVRLRY